MSERELRRIVLKEEFVALTGDYIKAIILAQLEYWQKRAREFDKFIIEEKERSMREGMEVTMNLTHGWIYKSAQELSEETMLGLSKSNIRAHLKALIDAGYVRERPNPYYKWDKTMQYRLDLVKIKQDLNRLGYELQDWVLDVSAQNHTSSVLEHRSTQREPSERQAEGEEDGGDEDSNVSAQNHTSSILERRSTQSRTSMFQNRTSRFYFRTSMFQNRTAIPDTITEITNNISTPPIV
ncbi:MAG: winged helix-turn-helix domain-containing protein, partial [Candidatus Methanosuratincola sp.]